MRYSYLSVLALFAFVLATHQTYSQVNEKDSLALVAIYNAMDGPNWVNQENWLTGPVESWQGVTTSKNRVTRLYFSDNGLKGPIPTEFNDLDTLISASFRDTFGCSLRKTQCLNWTITKVFAFIFWASGTQWDP